MTCDPADVDVLTTGGLSDPKPDAGLLEFNTPGGATEPDVPGAGDVVTGDEVVVAGGVVEDGWAGGVNADVGGDGGADDDEEEDDDGKTQEPVLGLVLTIIAVPPKSQLVGDGFFW